MKTNSEIRKSNLRIASINSSGGMARIDLGDQECSVIWGRNEDGKEHVSVNGYNHTPSWDDMCVIKDIFWNDNEECYQLHPKKSQYVNILEHCLHIWKDIPKEG